ncbi:hypothetical protein NE865_12320 [Phthorimaea operculella]|nr:hypothetical protein NE865_12320 [Phthorimaea operculella]
MARCGKCNQVVKDNERKTCTQCLSVYHLSCISSENSPKGAKKPTDLWKCPKCNPSAFATPAAPQSHSTDQLTLVDLKNYFENKLEAVKKDILQELTVEIKKVESRAASIETKYDLILGKINTLESTSKDAHKKQVDQEKRIVALEEQINQLRTEMKSLNEYKVSTDQQLAEFDAVKRNLNDVEQRARLTNLEIFGVPERKNEDLVATMVEIASHCECEFPVKREDFEYVTRVQPRTKQPGLPKTIVAKFKSIQLKDAFLSAARKRRGMTTTDIKITGDSKKVYVNEHLTSTNKAFLKAARGKMQVSRVFLYLDKEH